MRSFVTVPQAISTLSVAGIKVFTHALLHGHAFAILTAICEWWRMIG